MTDDVRREDARAARERMLDRALDRALARAPDPEPPADLAHRILAAAWRTPQEPPPARAAWFVRPRGVAATLAAAAVCGFLVGWTEPMLIADAQALDVVTVAFGPEAEIDQ